MMEPTFSQAYICGIETINTITRSPSGKGLGLGCERLYVEKGTGDVGRIKKQKIFLKCI